MVLETSEQLDNLTLRRTRKPAEIYKFWNDNNSYYRTSTDVPISYEGNTYTPTAIKRGGTSQSIDLTVGRVRITTAYDEPIIAEYLGSSPMQYTFVEIRDVYRNQTPKESTAIFIGVIQKVSFKGLKCTINCVGIERLLRVKVPRLRYQAKCPLTVYKTRCGVDAVIYGVTGNVVSVAANGLSFVLTEAGGYDDGYFNLGYAEKTAVPTKMITNHVGTTVYLRIQMIGLAATNSVTIYPGCDKLMATCKDKFNNLGNDNLDRFLGYPYIPRDNPSMWRT